MISALSDWLLYLCGALWLAAVLAYRSLLLGELEKEEKEKDWYYAQLQNLTKRIDSLPLTENVTPFSVSLSLLCWGCVCCVSFVLWSGGWQR